MVPRPQPTTRTLPRSSVDAIPAFVSKCMTLLASLQFSAFVKRADPGSPVLILLKSEA